MSNRNIRFDLLFPNRVSSNHNPKGLTSAERELQEYDERRKPARAQVIEASDEEDDFVLSQGSSSRPKSKAKPNNRQQGSMPGTNPNTAVLVPSGVSRGGLSAITLGTGGDDYHVEPQPSNTNVVGRFCLFNLVVKFPYKYMQDPDSTVSKHFFAAEQIYNRQWDMHYLRDPATSKLLMFVPVSQVEQLTADINATFNLKTSVPPYPFQICFYEGTPSPQKLGNVNSKDDMLNLQANVPEAPEDYGEPPDNATDAQQQDYAIWQEKLEKAVEAQKNKKSTSKSKDIKRQMRIANDAKALARTQQYLGIASEDVSSIASDLDMSKPAPHPFKDEPVFISVDVESWEMNHSQITEIGVTTLDTHDLINLEPTKWNTKLRSRHFRISGREHLTNHRFVNGHPDHFQFGASEFIPIEEAACIVDSCFVYPFSAGYECAGPRHNENGTLIQQPPLRNPEFNQADSEQKRNVILVGHAVTGDIEYLSKLGCTVTQPPFSFLETLDTAILYGSYKKDGDNAPGLAKACYDLCIDAFFLHNAGNDARYTLEALLKIALLAKPTQPVEKVVQQMPLVVDEPRADDKPEISSEENDGIYLEKAGLSVNERVDHSTW